MGEKEDEGLHKVRPEDGHPPRKAPRDQAPKQELLGEPRLDHAIEQRQFDRQRAETEAAKRLERRSLSHYRRSAGAGAATAHGGDGENCDGSIENCWSARVQVRPMGDPTIIEVTAELVPAVRESIARHKKTA